MVGASKQAITPLRGRAVCGGRFSATAASVTAISATGAAFFLCRRDGGIALVVFVWMAGKEASKQRKLHVSYCIHGVKSYAFGELV